MAKSKSKKIKKKTDEKKAAQKRKINLKTQTRQREGAKSAKTQKKTPASSEKLASLAAAKTHSKSSKTVSAKKAIPKPQTMAELLAQTGYQLRGLRRGQEIEGTVSEIGKNKLFIDIGAKTEGMVLAKEYELAKDFIISLKVGDKIKVIVGMPESEKGQILLSLRKTNEDYKWKILADCLKEGREVEVRGLDINKGGMIARFMNIYGFIPASQFGRLHLGNLNQLYNKTFKVKIIEAERSKNRLIFSEKAVSEAQALADQEKAVKLVKIGDVLEGVVSGIMPFGIFARVDIEGPASSAKEADSAGKKEDKEGKEGKRSLFLEGLVHISEISWEKVDNLNKLYKAGDKIKVKVLGIDGESNRLNLSVKQLEPDPWASLVAKYQLEKKFTGRVSKLAAFGAFINLEKNIEGLVHISKIPADYQIKVGDKVDVYVEKVDLEHHRIALGLVLSKKPVGYK